MLVWPLVKPEKIFVMAGINDLRLDKMNFPEFKYYYSQLIDSINQPTDTQEIYDIIIECFDFYNDFIKEKNINLKPIEDGFYELVEIYINDIVKGMV